METEHWHVASPEPSRAASREERYEEAVAEERFRLRAPRGVRLEEYLRGRLGGASRWRLTANGSTEELETDPKLPWSLGEVSHPLLDASRREKILAAFRACAAVLPKGDRELAVEVIARARRFRAGAGAEEQPGRAHELSLAISIARGAGAKTFRSFASSTAQLDSLFEGDSRPSERIRRYLAQRSAWPCPYGATAVVWSRASAMELLRPLFLAFEGESYIPLGHFDARALALPTLQFDCADEPLVDLSAVDHEGTRVRSLPFLFQGRMQRVAASRATAKKLSIDATGHGRRSHFDDRSPRSIPWRLVVRPKESLIDMRSQVGDGLLVSDVQMEVVSAGDGPIPSIVRVYAEDVRLLHGGVAGELVEPFCWEGPYHELLRSIRMFDANTETVTYRRRARGGSAEWPVDVVLGDAFSPALEVPGTVPRSQYW